MKGRGEQNSSGTIFQHFLLVVAIGYFLIFFAVALARITYPYALEWAEGGMLDHVYRILEGKPLYVAPSLEFTTYTYTPLYFYLSAALAKIIGVGFFPLRLISLLATIGCFYLIFLFVYRETGCRFCGLLAAALYAACFHICGDWYDIGRVDSLLLFFLLWGFLLFRFHQSRWHAIGAAMAFLIAFWIKQTALVITLPLLLYSLLPSQRRERWIFVVVYIVSMLATVLYMQMITKGWFFYYVFYLPRLHPLMREQAYQFFLSYFIRPLPIVTVIVIVFLSRQWRDGARARVAFWLLSMVAFIGGTWIANIPSGSYHNVAMPALALLAILFGIALNELKEHHGNGKFSLSPLVLLLMILVQFVALLYNPLRMVPRAKDRTAGDELVQRLRVMEGRILLPSHSYLLHLAGKPSCAHLLALTDALRDQKTPAGIKLHAAIAQTIAAGRYRFIILDEPWFISDIEKYYRPIGNVFSDATVYWPLIGYRTRPEKIYQAKGDTAAMPLY